MLRGDRLTVIERGQVYWLQGPLEGREENGVAHPHLVLQETEINLSRVETVPKHRLDRLLGRLSEERVREVLQGMAQRARFGVPQEE